MPRSIFAKLHRRFGPQISRSTLVQMARAKADSIREEGIPVEEDSFSLERAFSAGTSVAVVGAGFAGLSTAYYLSREGANVTVFEARGQSGIGGRVQTLGSFISGRFVEAGAELIGLNHSMWLHLALEFELSLNVLTPESDFAGAGMEMPMWLKLHGTRTQITPAQQEQIKDEIEKLYASWNSLADQVNADHPWLSPAHIAALDSDTVDTWISKHRLSTEADVLVRFGLENDQTVPVTDQSFLGLLCAVKGGATSTKLTPSTPSEYWTQTEVFRCAHGNQALARALQEKIESKKPKAFEFLPVTEIDLMSNCPSVTVAASAPRVFDWVVVAVPPSIYGAIKFHGISVAKGVIGFGEATKYLARLDRRFWLRNHDAPSGVDEELGAFWEPTDNQIANGTLEFGVSFFRGGSGAKDIIPTRATRTTAIEDAIEAALPGYKGACQKPAEEADWPTKDWIKIGYSCPKKGQVLNEGRFLNARHQRLVFAGEHTSMAFFGYMEGALRSGLRAASQIVGRRLRP